MRPDIKFCGMTRPEDVAAAMELGAAYVGVVFAPGGRRLSAARAAEVLRPTRGHDVRRVGVFGDEAVHDVLAAADIAGVDVLQLHGERTADDIAELRARFSGDVWVVVRVGAGGIDEGARWKFTAAHGVLLDTLSVRGLGGTGEAFDWGAVSGAVHELRGRTRVIVAGGLHAGNLAPVRRALDPDVLDVSSGIESAVGIKDGERMRAFAAAARSAILP